MADSKIISLYRQNKINEAKEEANALVKNFDTIAKDFSRISYNLECLFSPEYNIVIFTNTHSYLLHNFVSYLATQFKVLVYGPYKEVDSKNMANCNPRFRPLASFSQDSYTFPIGLAWCKGNFVKWSEVCHKLIYMPQGDIEDISLRDMSKVKGVVFRRRKQKDVFASKYNMLYMPFVVAEHGLPPQESKREKKEGKGVAYLGHNKEVLTLFTSLHHKDNNISFHTINISQDKVKQHTINKDEDLLHMLDLCHTIIVDEGDIYALSCASRSGLKVVTYNKDITVDKVLDSFKQQGKTERFPTIQDQWTAIHALLK